MFQYYKYIININTCLKSELFLELIWGKLCAKAPIPTLYSHGTITAITSRSPAVARRRHSGSAAIICRRRRCRLLYCIIIKSEEPRREETPGPSGVVVVGGIAFVPWASGVITAAHWMRWMIRRRVRIVRACVCARASVFTRAYVRSRVCAFSRAFRHIDVVVCACVTDVDRTGQCVGERARRDPRRLEIEIRKRKVGKAHKSRLRSCWSRRVRFCGRRNSSARECVHNISTV